MVLGQETGAPFLGDNLLAYLVLALGAALFVGNLLAVLKPRQQAKEGELDQAPVVRSVAMGLVGLVAAVWAVASLLGA